MQVETATQKAIRLECESVRDLLLAKNKAYGDSAIKPMHVMSQSGAAEAIAVRIDDKLSRIRNSGGLVAALQNSDVEDTVQDLIGYLILARVAQKVNGASHGLPAKTLL